jgi:hypothetical protein
MDSIIGLVYESNTYLSSKRRNYSCLSDRLTPHRAYMLPSNVMDLAVQDYTRISRSLIELLLKSRDPRIVRCMVKFNQKDEDACSFRLSRPSPSTRRDAILQEE